MSKDETRRHILAVTALAVTTAFFAGCSPKDIPDEDLYGPEYSTSSSVPVSPSGDDESITETSSGEDSDVDPTSSSVSSGNDSEPITSSGEDSTAAPKTSSSEDSNGDSDPITSKPETSESVSSSRDDDPTTSSSSEDSTGEPPVPSSKKDDTPVSSSSTTSSSKKDETPVEIPAGTTDEYFDANGNPMPSNFDPSNGGYYNKQGNYIMTDEEYAEYLRKAEQAAQETGAAAYDGTSGMSKEDRASLEAIVAARLGLK